MNKAKDQYIFPTHIKNGAGGPTCLPFVALTALLFLHVKKVRDENEYPYISQIRTKRSAHCEYLTDCIRSKLIKHLSSIVSAVFECASSNIVVVDFVACHFGLGHVSTFVVGETEDLNTVLSSVTFSGTF